MLGWATQGGYRALEVPDGGTLEAGKRADLIMIRTDRPHLVPLMRVASSFVHQDQGADVQSVMFDGEWIMRNSLVLAMDEATIVAEADCIARRAWARLFTERPDLPVLPASRCAYKARAGEGDRIGLRACSSRLSKSFRAPLEGVWGFHSA
ncbi:amidohydrolase family protein (plasmid) [Roseomonas marmotae]|uniref:Amidohydrolase family protein n=1 Tax=Roseomonas marmotae TaxID=2768161 RepID=A0ABS3KL00_9PROT|nr:amidohydrolase family protein [Roseomonas marmotae]QTI81066.1 amidohydrolase family protein [Roseomonas marmotae]